MTSIADSKLQVIYLSLEEFHQLSNPPRLIDVRFQGEYNQFHAPNAVNLSLPRILMNNSPWLRRYVVPQWFQELPKNEPVALICLTAHRSPIAAKQLVKAGFTEVYNITGGMMEWRKLGFPTCNGK
ncbi:MAG: rhodanese-like domain-containing protein [Xenococcaceae cyanobacterium]